MKSRISFSKLTALKKDITRFAPLWAVYLIGGLLVMMTITDSYYPGGVADTLGETIGPFSIINLIYAALAAQLLFGDLYSSRLCNALHAMPLRREQWFLSHIGAGLCFSVVPHLIVLPIMMLRMGEFWFVGLYWLLGMSLEYLFFFGLAVFSCLCVGNRFAMVAVYAILNFGSMIAYWFCATIYQPMMYGVIISGDVFRKLCPVVNMTTHTQMVVMDSINRGYQYSPVYTYEGLGEGWGYVLVCAGIGIALLGAALLLYRRRKLESAGDFIAVRPMAPIFSVVFTLCVSAVCAMFGSLFSESYMTVFLIAGLIVGYFAGQMLLQRTAKVFKGKAFVKLGAIAAAMILSLLLVKWDAFGIVRWVPETDQVKKVTLAFGDLELTEPEDVQLVLNLHQAAVEWGEPDYTQANSYVWIQYELKSGRHVERRYQIPVNSQAYQALKAVYGRVSVVLGEKAAEDWEGYLQSVDAVRVDGTELDFAAAKQILEAVKLDCRAGTMAQRSAYHQTDPILSLEVQTIDDQGLYDYRNVWVYSDASYTLAALKEYRTDISKFLGLDCSWEEFLKRLVCIQWNYGLAIEDPEEMASLMEAVKTDCAEGKLYPEDGRNKKGVFYIVWGDAQGNKSDARDICYYYDCKSIEKWLLAHYPEEMAAGY